MLAALDPGAGAFPSHLLGASTSGFRPSLISLHGGLSAPGAAGGDGAGAAARSAARTRAADGVDLRAQLYDRRDPENVTAVVVRVAGTLVPVPIDSERGPRWGLRPDDFVDATVMTPTTFRRGTRKQWQTMTITEQEIALIVVAKKIPALYQQVGVPFPPEVRIGDEQDQGPKPSGEEQGLDATARMVARCNAELARPPIPWGAKITIDTVTSGHSKRGKGMLYGLEFPWTEATLVEWGPNWLTAAFHAAGTLDKGNQVTKIIPEEKVKVTTGNNGGKFLFEVRYKRVEAGLHTRLFAKVPFPLEGVTRSDRLSSSVNKQPQELYEINTYRLLEASLPLKTPRFYYGDICKESSNWILITECVPFSDKAKINFGKPTAKKAPLKPFQIEGPYDKCVDHNLRGDPLEYYLVLVRGGAMIAGLYKAGKLGSREKLRDNFSDMEGLPIEAFGMHWAASGEDPRMFKPKVDLAITFISETGKKLFPGYVTDQAFLAKLRTILMTLNAYKAEISYWKHKDPDYVALTHQNMNVDNAYFWRDADGNLECGVFDWGAMGSNSLGHKLWWWLYCMDFEPFKAHLPKLLEVFSSSYQEFGGPALDEELLRRMVMLTALEQMLGLAAAVPQILRMCPQREWATIDDRYDPRIAENIDGKSTLRLYLHVINTIVRIVEEMHADQVLETWISECFVAHFNMPAKAPGIIDGTTRSGMGL